MTQQSQIRNETVEVDPNGRQIVRNTKTETQSSTSPVGKNDYKIKKAIFRSYQVIWYVLVALEVLLASRLFLKLVGANTASGFTSFIYALSNPFTYPFAGIIGTSNISNNIFEWSTLIAMAVYLIATYGIVALFQFVKPTDETEVNLAVDRP